jgi:hypothetical protein
LEPNSISLYRCLEKPRHAARHLASWVGLARHLAADAWHVVAKRPQLTVRVGLVGHHKKAVDLVMLFGARLDLFDLNS